MESQLWTPITHGVKQRMFTPDIGFILKGLKVLSSTHTYWLLREMFLTRPADFAVGDTQSNNGTLSLFFKFTDAYTQLYRVHYYTGLGGRIIYYKIEAEDCYRVMRPIVVFKV